MSKRSSALFAAALLAVALSASVAAANPRIEWRVENPFRLFNDPADSEIHRQTLLSLSPEERRQPVLNSERALANRHPEGWAATMFKKTCWHWADNRHACADQPDYLSPKSHVVVASVRDLEALEAVCTWLTAPLGRGKGRGRATTQPCAEPVLLDVPYPSGAEISVEVGANVTARRDAELQPVLGDDAR